MAQIVWQFLNRKSKGFLNLWRLNRLPQFSEDAYLNQYGDHPNVQPIIGVAFRDENVRQVSNLYLFMPGMQRLYRGDQRRICYKYYS